MAKTVIQTSMWDCPLCGKTHPIDCITRDAIATINGQTFTYRETVYRCNNCNNSHNEFIPGDVIDDNQEEARRTYIHMHSSPKFKNLNRNTQMYKTIPVRLIIRNYAGYKAKRFTINGTNQNIWIPNKHLTPDGSILPNQNLDYIFNTPTGRHKCKLAGI